MNAVTTTGIDDSSKAVSACRHWVSWRRSAMGSPSTVPRRSRCSARSSPGDAGRRPPPRLRVRSAEGRPEGQISDWLTKIIVGVGLVQFGTIVAHYEKLNGTLAVSAGDSASGAVAGVLIAFFGTLGFLLGHVVTRTSLMSTFRYFDGRGTTDAPRRPAV